MTEKINNLTNIETGNRRIYFTFKDVQYSVNITNEGKLRLSVADGGIQILPLAENCIMFEEVDNGRN